MSIPKKAQRAIDKANKDRAARVAVKSEVIAQMPIPRVMAVGVTPRSVMNLHEVYFNDVLQKLCTLADVDKGLIRRYTAGNGMYAHKNTPQEELHGKVEIRRRVL